MNKVKITITGRVEPNDAVEVALYLSKQFSIHSRSDLVSTCFSVVASLARQQGGEFKIENYEHAFEILEKLGLKWDSKKADKEKLYAFQLDALEDLEPVQIAEIRSIIEKARRGGQPEIIKEEKKSSLLIELEKIEAEIQKEEEENR